MKDSEISFAHAYQQLMAFDWQSGDIRELVATLGCGLPAYFQQKYLGGLDVQQVPAEIEQLIQYLWHRRAPLDRYLEIGIGKCGTFMLLSESWKSRGWEPQRYVADNFSYASVEQRERFEWVRERYPLTAYLGNTRDPEFRRFLDSLEFDLIFIDGDHSFAGCLADFATAYPRLSNQGTMVFHDIASSACPGVRRVFDMARRFFGESETFVHSRSCGIGVLLGKERDKIPFSVVQWELGKEIVRDILHAAKRRARWLARSLLRTKQ